MRRLFTALAVALAALLTVPAAASANGLYGPAPAADVSTLTPTAGEPFVFTAAGFLAGSDVTVSVDAEGDVAINGDAGDTAVLEADGEGTIEATIEIDGTGTATITAAGTGADGEALSVSETVTVQPADSAAPVRDEDDDADEGDADALPRTGSSGIGTLLLAGTALLAVGALILGFVGVKRRRTTA